MRRALGQELLDAPIDGEDKFESLHLDKGMRTRTLPKGVVEDINSQMCHISKGNTVKDNNHSHKVASIKAAQGKKKKDTKRPIPSRCQMLMRIKGDHGNEGAKQDAQRAGDVPPPDPMLEPFIAAPTKGDKGTILKGNSGAGNAQLA